MFLYPLPTPLSLWSTHQFFSSLSLSFSTSTRCRSGPGALKASGSAGSRGGRWRSALLRLGWGAGAGRAALAARLGRSRAAGGSRACAGGRPRAESGGARARAEGAGEHEVAARAAGRGRRGAQRSTEQVAAGRRAAAVQAMRGAQGFAERAGWVRAGAGARGRRHKRAGESRRRAGARAERNGGGVDWWWCGTRGERLQLAAGCVGAARTGPMAVAQTRGRSYGVRVGGVVVEDFCASRCGHHRLNGGSAQGQARMGVRRWAPAMQRWSERADPDA
jgi:hypothetical protein